MPQVPSATCTLSLADFSADAGDAGDGAAGIGRNLTVLVVHDVSERVAMEQALQGEGSPL